MKKLLNKKTVSAVLLLAGFTLIGFSGCGQPPCEDCDITCTDCTLYENHDISACGVKDPLRNIEWLKDYCKNLNEEQTFLKVHISLYKVIGTDEHLFRIDETFLRIYSPRSFSEFKNCAGTTIFNVSDEVYLEAEEFMKDKEFVAELFDWHIPVCGICNPLEDIKWLKEYCESVKENQDISSIYITLFRSKDEYIFEIKTFSYYYDWSTVYKNCAGNVLDYSPKYGEYVTELLYLINKQ